MSFRYRIAWILIVAVLAVLTATAFTAGRASHGIRQDIERARGEHLLNTLKNTVDSNLAIGLTLDQMSVLQTLIEREKGGANDVLAIDIFLPDATLLYSTDRGVVGAPVGDEWVARLATHDTWQIASRGETVLGARVDNDLGAPAGGIAVTLADDDEDRALLTQAWPILKPWLPVALAAALLAVAAAVLVNRRMMRPYREVTGVLTGRGDEGSRDADRTDDTAGGVIHAATHDAPRDATRPNAGGTHIADAALHAAALQTRRAWADARRRVDIATAGLREIDDVQ